MRRDFPHPALSGGSLSVTLRGASLGCGGMKGKDMAIATWEMNRERLLDKLTANPDVRILEHRTKEEWLRARQNYVTASDVATLMGRSSYSGLYRLAHEKMGLLDNTERDETEWQRAGHYLEPAIAQWYADDTGRAICDPGDYTLVTNDKFPGMAATLDRLAYDSRLGLGVLEMKNRGLTTSDDWRSEVPENVRIQIQAQLLITGLKWGSAAALVGGNQFYWADVFSNRAFQASMIMRVSRFWSDLANGILPQPGQHPDDEAVLAELHPNDNGETVVLEAEFRSVYEELLDIKSQMDALERRKSALQAAIKERLGDNTYGVGPGFQFSLKTQSRAEQLTIKPSSEAEKQEIIKALKKIRVKANVTSGTSFRVLRMKEIENG